MGIVERSSFVPCCEHWESYTYCSPMYLSGRINFMEFQALHSSLRSSLSIFITTFALKTLVLFLSLSKLHNGRVTTSGSRSYREWRHLCGVKTVLHVVPGINSRPGHRYRGVCS